MFLKRSVYMYLFLKVLLPFNRQQQQQQQRENYTHCAFAVYYFLQECPSYLLTLLTFILVRYFATPLYDSYYTVKTVTFH